MTLELFLRLYGREPSIDIRDPQTTHNWHQWWINWYHLVRG